MILRITGDIYIEYRSPVCDFQMRQAVVGAFRTANFKCIYITRLYEANVATFGSIDIDSVGVVGGAAAGVDGEERTPGDDSSSGRPAHRVIGNVCALHAEIE